MKLLLYCTKAKPYLHKTQCIFDNSPIEWQLLDYDHYKKDPYYAIFGTLVCDLDRVNGKIVAECDFEVEKITPFKDYTGYEEYDIHYQTAKRDYERLLQETCLNNNQLEDYLYSNDGEGYANHIKNLHIFDKSKELSECHKKYGGINYSPIYYMPITNAPQNMMRVWLYENGKWVMYILISIRPEWLCKILNGEKTIEVRKKVLKEMLK